MQSEVDFLKRLSQHTVILGGNQVTFVDDTHCLEQFLLNATKVRGLSWLTVRNSMGRTYGWSYERFERAYYASKGNILCKWDSECDDDVFYHKDNKLDD